MTFAVLHNLARTLCITLLSIVILLAALLVNAKESHPIDALQPRHWYEVPNSQLEAVSFRWPPEVKLSRSQIDGIITGWGGGAYDTKRDRLIIWGGGHAAYAGNEIYVFDVNALRWERVTEPSLRIGPQDKRTDTGEYPDANGAPDPRQPRARHTYNTIQYIPTIDKFCGFGSPAHYPEGGSRRTHCFDFESKQWERKADAGAFGFGGPSAYDPTTGHIWMKGTTWQSGILAEWDPIKDVWTTRSRPYAQYDYYMTAAIDTKRRRLVAVGTGKAYALDLNAQGLLSPVSLTTTGDTDIVNATAPGFDYDPVSDKFVAWKGGADVYTLNPDTLVWQRIAPASTNTITPTAAARNGTFGRFRYMPAKNAFIVVNSIRQNVYIYKLTPGSGSPSPKDTTAPSVPTNLKVQALSYSQIQLSWTPSTDNIGVAGYGIFRNGTQLGTTSNSSYTDTGLSPSTTYTYTLVAYDAAGNTTAHSRSASATTLPPDLTPPSAPQQLTATPASSSQINLSWTASRDDVGVAGYKIFRDGMQMATATFPEQTTAQDTGLSPSTTYTYTVQAYDAAGNVSPPAAPARAATRAGRLLQVGPTRALTKPSQAAAVAQDGDTIEIDAHTYGGDVAVWKRNYLTLRGVGGRPHLKAEGKDAQGKGIWVITGTHTTVENIEFSGAKVRDRNGAAIRQEGRHLIVRSCSFHGNENGILGGGGPQSTVLIEYSEFAHNGYGDGRTHNMYIDRVGSFTLRYSYVHHAKVGHNVKTRGHTNYILYNRIMDEQTGTSSYALDIPDGGLTYIVGNLIQQGPHTENHGIIAYAAERTTNPIQELYIVNNTIVNDGPPSARFIRLNGTPTAKIINNLFVGPGTVLSGTAAMITNLTTTNPGFVDRANFDYRLTPASPALKAGTEPGAGHDFNLSPTAQYVHPARTEARAAAVPLDIGAYAFR